jgi:RNA polymerase sigma-70 factor (ECF subfamily)
LIDLESILARIREGDESAFEMLFKSMSSPLYYFALRLVHDEEKAEEIVHDVFLKIWNDRKKVDIKIALKSYLYKSVHNAAINWLVHCKTKKLNSVLLLDDEAWERIIRTSKCDSFLIEAIEAVETENIIIKSVEELPQQCREVFKMSRFELKSVKEISEILGITPTTVKTQLYRALARLAVSLKENK